MSRQAERIKEESRGFSVISIVCPPGRARFFSGGFLPAESAETHSF
ncbi:hypothetical protein GCWU000341_01711 [Oribacterium sp. oral taxon 078 str. F0262]|nr:hypothetical protein GCWU000341_01711 [Oribacterium sp. oral taxon 078 str. F0262]